MSTQNQIESNTAVTGTKQTTKRENPGTLQMTSRVMNFFFGLIVLAYVGQTYILKTMSHLKWLHSLVLFQQVVGVVFVVGVVYWAYQLSTKYAVIAASILVVAFVGVGFYQSSIASLLTTLSYLWLLARLSGETRKVISESQKS